MQQIIAFFMSIITLISALIPGLGGSQVQGVTTGDWLTMLDEQFGMTTYDESAAPYYDNVGRDDPYFAAVQIAYEWGVIDDTDVIDVNEFVKTDFVAKTLVRVALLEANQPVAIKNASKLDDADEIAVAVTYGLVPLQWTGRFKVAVMLREKALEALAKAREIWATKKFGEAIVTSDTGEDVVDLTQKVDDYTVDASKVTLPAAQAQGVQAGDIVLLPQTADNPAGAAVKVAAINTAGANAVIIKQDVELAEIYDSLSFQGDVAPVLAASQIVDGNGNTLQAAAIPEGGDLSQIDIGSLLQKIDVDFSIGMFDFGLKVTDTGFNLDVGADIVNGVHLQKKYEISNLNVSTKFDGNIASGSINEAYIRADYDLADITTLTGSYAASVAVDESKLPEGAEPIDFMTAAKDGLLTLVSGGGNKITVFTVNIPIPNLPTVTISLDVNIRITVNGKIEITITSSQVKGLEIIDNKVRIINEAEYLEETYDIMADIRFTVGLCLSVKVLGYIVVDVEFEAGIGIKVTAFIKADAAEYVIDIPLDLAIQIPYPTGGMDSAEFCGNAKIYGLMSVSVGKNSGILKKLGLTKTWVIFDENNAVICNLHIEENGVVDDCTRARTGR